MVRLIASAFSITLVALPLQVEISVIPATGWPPQKGSWGADLVLQLVFSYAQLEQDVRGNGFDEKVFDNLVCRHRNWWDWNRNVLARNEDTWVLICLVRRNCRYERDY